MKDLAHEALNTINVAGATYGDIRIIDIESESIQVKNSNINVLKRNKSRGFGIRVIKNGAWGFAASSELTKESIRKTATLAVKIAESSARLKDKDVVLGEAPKIVDKYVSQYELDPFKVPAEEKINLLLQADELMRKVKGIKLSEAGLSFWRTNKLFASSEGSFIEQQIIESGGAINATSVKNGETGSRGYPGFLRGHYKTMGYEFVKGLKFLDNAERVAGEAVALLSAPELEETTTTIILDGSMVAIQVHETIGHPTELDRVFGTEVSLAGASHMTPDKLNKLQMGSPDRKSVV